MTIYKNKVPGHKYYHKKAQEVLEIAKNQLKKKKTKIVRIDSKTVKEIIIDEND